MIRTYMYNNNKIYFLFFHRNEYNDNSCVNLSLQFHWHPPVTQHSTASLPVSPRCTHTLFSLGIIDEYPDVQLVLNDENNGDFFCYYFFYEIEKMHFSEIGTVVINKTSIRHCFDGVSHLIKGKLLDGFFKKILFCTSSKLI